MTGAAQERLALLVPEELIEALAERVAALLLEPAAAPPAPSPWLDVEAAAGYLGLSRDQLYKLTAARAIPFRKKRGGQRLLFHRDELDAWIKAAYESTGCLP